MVSPFTLPPTGFGPGSQPDPDGELQYMPMPSGMRIYAPHIPDADDTAAMAEAVAMLARMADACSDVANGAAPVTFDLATLSPAAREVLADALGQGEVSMKLRGLPAVLVQESVFAGVWLLLAAGMDVVEVAPVPTLAMSRAHVPHRPAIGVLARPVPGLANAPALLAELVDKSLTRKAGAIAHVVNLSLLPHTPTDLDWLSEALGEGAVTVLSRGYGNCRVTACAQPHVWKVQFYNSMDTLILDTYEVCEIPEVAIAAAEDLTDSATRIRDVIEAIQ
ncbi:hydrogenase expression/formation protein [Pseudotabrizicola alkalilacus]|uniref:Hydrogenase expression/formation protein n=1 Tax=Pseudotabrizicola alkalilacus TaxID=2305252 RepID=A0A411Z4Q3_9RHOB|nr:hydrogenase expression/formation protein [Pseudotabrizicola alkalilacus]RGP38076.1 hydrogenase expression/formation protein [Pseudotabrizicola alkalilacus]